MSDNLSCEPYIYEVIEERRKGEKLERRERSYVTYLQEYEGD
jgi:hypothetical protein